MNNIEKEIHTIIDAVKQYKDRAIIKYTKQIDKVKLSPEMFRIRSSEFYTANKLVNKRTKQAIKEMIKRVTKFHNSQMKNIQGWSFKNNGYKIVSKIQPLQSVGVYIPGGKFCYPSTVVMSVIPAKVAGVKRIIITTPPKSITPEVLYTALLCGIDEVYRIGGPMAIAALAYGTETIPKVDKIVGPGNVYITTAKKILYGKVGIDLLAGPTEIIIVADDSAIPEYVTKDITAQLEHGMSSRGFLVTNSTKLANKVNKLLPVRFRKQVTMKICTSRDEIINFVNQFAPEHLELMVRNADTYVKNITNAGAIFLGLYTPAVFGDYLAGPSHILPTNATAHFSSGLSVYDFLKFINIIYSSKKSILQASKYILELAKIEGFKEHAKAIQVRLK